MNSLRAELLGLPGLPSMRMLMPAGWRALPLSDEGTAELVGRLRTVFMQAHRPDLDSLLTESLTKWAHELRSRGGKYAVLPLDLPPDSALPMSLTVSIVADMGGVPLEDWVVAKIRGGSTRFLDEQRSVLAWCDAEVGRDDAAGVVTELHSYLIPVPGTTRRQAVLLAGVHLVPADETPDSPRRQAAQMLFDTMALAVDWPPAHDVEPGAARSR